MTLAATVCLVAAGTFAVTDWWAVARNNRRVEFVMKPATMIAFVAVALLIHPESGAERNWFVAALALSLAGDVFLMLRESLFVPGLAAFLLAHLAYIGGLRLEVHSATAVVIAAAVMLVVGGGLGSRVVRALRAGPHRDLSAPVIGYMLVISAMVATALATGDVVAALAALVFYSSDALIAEDRFVHPRTGQPVAIMVTYHAAQAAFVLSLLR